MPDRIRILILSLLFLSLLPAGSLRAQDALAQTDPAQDWQQAMDLLQKGQYGPARSAFEQIATTDERELYATEAQYYAAYCGLVLFHGDGEKKMNDFIAAHPAHPKAKLAWYELGMFYYRNNETTKALDYLSRVDREELPQKLRYEYDYTLGYSYFSKRKLEEARPYFDRFKVSNNSYRYAASYYSGFIAYDQDRYGDALTDLQRAAESDAYRGKTALIIASIYYRQGRYDEVIAFAEKELNGAGKERDQLLLLLGESWFHKGDYTRALTWYEQYQATLRKLPEPAVLYKIAYAQFKNGQDVAAIDNFKVVALEKSPQGQQASYYLGILYARQDNKQYALSAFHKAAQDNYNEAIKQEAAFQYAKMQSALGNYSLAIDAYTDYLGSYAQGNHRKEANDLLSEAYLHTDNYAQAIAHIEKINDLSPSLRRTYQQVTYYQGTVLFNKARYYDAVQHFNKSQRYPEDKSLSMQAHYWTGEAYSIGKRWNDAINAYASVFRTGEGNNKEVFLQTRYGIGYAYFNTRQYDKALVHFREYTTGRAAASDKGNYVDALLRLADCYYATKDYDKAIAKYQQSISEGTPDAGYALYQTGLIQGIRTDYAQAMTTLDRMISRYPQSRFQDEARFQRGQFLFEQGKYQEAIKAFDDLIGNYASSPSVPYALVSKAISHSNLRETEKTISTYKRFIDDYPSHEKAQAALLGLQQALNNADRSEEFEQYLAAFRQANPGDESLETVEYEAAKSLYFSQKYDAAAGSLARFIDRYPNSSSNIEAHYYLAEAYYRLDKTGEAITQYRYVTDENSSIWVNRALLRLATILYTEGQYEEALTTYSRLSDAAANKKDLYYGLAGMMDAQYQLARYEEVKTLARRILNEAPVTANAENKAQLYIAKAAYAKGDYAKAIDELLITLNTARDVYGAEAQYLLGEIYFLQKNYKQSLETLYDLNKTFGAYDYWLGKSFLLIADNFVALKEYFQAKETLKSVIEKSTEPEIVELAKTRLQDLNKIEKDLLQSSDTTATGSAKTQPKPDSTSIELKNQPRKQED